MKYSWESSMQVRKNLTGMWSGRCWECGHYWQFWFWGATLGYGYQHLRSGHRLGAHHIENID